MGAPTPIRDDIAAEELRPLDRQEGEGRVACRLLALANAWDGMSRARAARQAGRDRQPLRDWVIRFNAEGIEGLRDLGPGAAARLGSMTASWRRSKPWCCAGPRPAPRGDRGGRPGAPRRARRRQPLASGRSDRAAGRRWLQKGLRPRSLSDQRHRGLSARPVCLERDAGSPWSGRA